MSIQVHMNALEDYLLEQAKLEREYEVEEKKYANDPEAWRHVSKRYEREMSKGVAGIGLDTINPSIPEDLDPVFRSLDPKNMGYGRCTLLRATPAIKGYARQHEYTLQTETGMGGTSGFAGEFDVGNFQEPTQKRITSLLRWQKLVWMKSRSAGEVRHHDFSEQQRRLNLYRLQNSAMFWGDSRRQLNGESGLAVRGLIEQIENGTNGNDANFGTDGYNYNERGHVWDAKGATVTASTVRQIPDHLFQIWGTTESMVALMPNRVVSGMEAAEDTNRRHYGPMDAYFQGQVISGLVVNGRHIPYIPDDDLDPFSRDNVSGMYKSKRPRGAPSSIPTVALTVQNEGTTDSLVYGNWDANPYGTGDVRYGVSWVDEADRESPATLSSAVTLTTGKEVKIVVSGVPSNATRIRVYRYDAEYGAKYGISSPAIGDACWIFDVAAPGDGSAITVIDHNEFRPYCGTGVLLPMYSNVLPYLTSREKYEKIVAEEGLAGITPFVSEEASMYRENSLRRVHVGPQVFTHLLANTQDTVQHNMIGSWWSLELMHPQLCGILRNLPLK